MPCQQTQCSLQCMTVSYPDHSKTGNQILDLACTTKSSRRHPGTPHGLKLGVLTDTQQKPQVLGTARQERDLARAALSGERLRKALAAQAEGHQGCAGARLQLPGLLDGRLMLRRPALRFIQAGSCLGCLLWTCPRASSGICPDL